MECFHSAERSCDRVIGEEQQCADDCQDLAAAAGGGVDAAAIGIDAANLRVGPPDADDEDAHAGDEVEAGGAGDGKGQPKDVEAAGAPITKEQSAGLGPV